ncbi:unnamed protein product, partial [Didymodactylos carnosus]
DEEDLPTSVALDGDVDDDVVISKEQDTTWDDVVDPDVTKLVQKLTDEALSNSLIDIISPTRNCTSSTGINNSFVDNLISFDSPPENTASTSSSKTNNNDLLSLLLDDVDFSLTPTTVHSTQNALSILNEITSPGFLSFPNSNDFSSKTITSSLDLSLSSTQPSSSSLPSTSSRHDLTRQTATNNYLTSASKRMKLHHNYVDKLTDKFNIN